MPPARTYTHVHSRNHLFKSSISASKSRGASSSGASVISSGSSAVTTLVPSEPSQAQRCLRLARAGFAKQQWQVGMMMEHGLGLPQDPQQALSWYDKAAAKGLVKAKESLDELSYAIDKHAGTAIVEHDGMKLEFLPVRLRKDMEVVEMAVSCKGSGCALQFATDELRNDKNIVLKAVKSDGYALEFASQELRDNEVVCLEACRQNGFAMRFVSERLRHDKEWGKRAMQANGYSLKYAGKSLKDDHEVALLACKEQGAALQYAKWNPARNRDCIKAAITTGGAAAFEYAAKGSRLNPELLYHAVEKHAGKALNKAADAYRTSSPGSRKQAFIEKEKKRIESHAYVEGAEAPDFRHPVVLGEERD